MVCMVWYFRLPVALTSPDGAGAGACGTCGSFVVARRMAAGVRHTPELSLPSPISPSSPSSLGGATGR